MTLNTQPTTNATAAVLKYSVAQPETEKSLILKRYL